MHGELVEQLGLLGRPHQWGGKDGFREGSMRATLYGAGALHGLMRRWTRVLAGTWRNGRQG